MATEDERDEATWRGLRRLVILALPSPARLMRSVLGRLDTPPVVAGGPYGSTAEWMDDCLACAVDAGMEGSGGAWDRESFERLVADVRDGLTDTLEHVGTTSAGILDALHRVDRAIDDTPDVFTDVLDDVELQLDRFVFPGFLSAVGVERLDDVRRYLDAIEYRLRKLPENPDRDRARMARVTALEAEHDRLSEILSWSPELVDLAWTLQELRVSLFAESIGARGTVSDTRVRAALEALLT
jgi:ATP-dependent helicase HrpA